MLKPRTRRYNTNTICHNVCIWGAYITNPIWTQLKQKYINATNIYTYIYLQIYRMIWCILYENIKEQTRYTFTYQSLCRWVCTERHSWIACVMEWQVHQLCTNSACIPGANLPIYHRVDNEQPSCWLYRLPADNDAWPTKFVSPVFVTWWRCPLRHDCIWRCVWWVHSVTGASTQGGARIIIKRKTTWWRHDMQRFSAVLALCEGIHR